MVPYDDPFPDFPPITDEEAARLEALVPPRPSRVGRPVFSVEPQSYGRCRLCRAMGFVVHVETSQTDGNLFSANFCPGCVNTIHAAAEQTNIVRMVDRGNGTMPGAGEQ